MYKQKTHVAETVHKLVDTTRIAAEKCVLAGDLVKLIPQYCIGASLLRTLFASFARAHERALVQNVGDSEINAPFLLNKHGDLYFFIT